MTLAHLAVQTLREELNYSLCVVSEQLEKEGAEVDWISVLNLCEKPYNSNGPKQYGIVPYVITFHAEKQKLLALDYYAWFSNMQELVCCRTWTAMVSACKWNWKKAKNFKQVKDLPLMAGQHSESRVPKE